MNRLFDFDNFFNQRTCFKILFLIFTSGILTWRQLLAIISRFFSLSSSLSWPFYYFLILIKSYRRCCFPTYFVWTFPGRKKMIERGGAGIFFNEVVEYIKIMYFFVSECGAVDNFPTFFYNHYYWYLGKLMKAWSLVTNSGRTFTIIISRLIFTTFLIISGNGVPPGWSRGIVVASELRVIIIKYCSWLSLWSTDRVLG